MSLGALGGTGTPNPLGSSSPSSLWNNPQLLQAMLPNYNVAALAQAMQAELNVAAIPLDQLSQQVSQLQSQVAAWTQLQSDLQSLQQDANTLAGQSLYQTLSATSSDPAAVTATATGTGTAATYILSVNQLMQQEIVNSGTQASASTSLGLSGSFSINGTTVQVSSSDSLQTIASAINAAGAGVTATVLPEGSSGYVLSLAASTGQAIQFGDPSGILLSLGILQSSATSVPQASGTTALGLSGTFSVNGTAIQVTSTETLQGLASALNNAGAGVSATVQQQSSGQYVLDVTSSNGQGIVWSDPNAILKDLGLFANEIQNPQEAQYTVNGVAEQSPTNSDSTSIPGVTLNFLQTAGNVTITTTQSQSAVVNAVQQLASDYNTLIGDLNKYTGKGGLLEGSGALLGLSSALYQALTTPNPNQPAGLQSLSQIGVSISAPVGAPQDLQMSVNTSALEAALGQNPAAVASLLSGAGGVATQLQQQLNTFVGAAGTVPAEISQLNQQIASLNGEINNPNSYVNQLIQEQDQQLQSEFNNMISALLQSQSQGQEIQGFLNAQFGSSGSNGGKASGG
jgi:flagellar hook-associated protein 2